MTFEFATANRIIFGTGSAGQVGQMASGLGEHALVVIGKDLERSAFLFRELDAHAIQCTRFSVSQEPNVSMILSGIETARQAGCDLVIAIGGGSVIDSGKAIAAMLTNHGDLYDYLEVIGKGQSIKNTPAPNIMLPTTAGTGAEVTRNAVIMSVEHHVKVSMRSPLMLPQIVVIDPELTYSMPPSVTAGTGLDALTQLLEAFVSTGANPMTDAVCRQGIKRATGALERAFINGGDKEARYDMCVASLFGGIALANAKLGAVHGIAGPFGGMFPSPHGAVCGRLLPEVMAMNIAALEGRMPDARAVARYAEIAQIVTADHKASALDGVTWVRRRCKRLQVPSLGAYGVSEDHFADIIQQSQKASSMKGNPVQLTDQELHTILQQAL